MKGEIEAKLGRGLCGALDLEDSYTSPSGVEAKKLGKKDILDFTDNLERVLLHAYNATKPVPRPDPEVPNVDLTEEEKAAEEARKALVADVEDHRRRDFIYRVPELI